MSLPAHTDNGESSLCGRRLYLFHNRITAAGPKEQDAEYTLILRNASSICP
ncbi:hypothetical protein ANACOL_01108 [Anaerotruncus colihominis DSM 17241]|uniref:Uncharacterized protein n=1 Tax=Anaerotruncus colihominis DSM 17241 TaxID=445972 RepID=B0P8L9_9FIRM|nr:hypothetical protein ANACOL_01108 [Anaerotruncus colihominis DSM 17241]